MSKPPHVLLPQPQNAPDNCQLSAVIGGASYQLSPSFIPLTRSNKPRGRGWKNEIFTAIPTKHYGVMCGTLVVPGYRLLAIDVDVKNGKSGWDSWLRLEADYDLPDTYSVRTPSGGFHFYYLVPEDVVESVFAAAQKAGYSDIELIGPGRFVVGPGSPRGDKTYEVYDHRPVAVGSDAFVSFLRSVPGKRRPVGRPGPEKGKEDTRKALAGSGRDPNHELFIRLKRKYVPETGNRNNTQFAAIGWLLGAKRVSSERTKIIMEWWVREYAEIFGDQYDEFVKNIDEMISRTVGNAEFVYSVDHTAITAKQVLAPEWEEWLAGLAERASEQDLKWLRVLLLHIQYQRSLGYEDDRIRMSDRGLVAIYNLLYSENYQRNANYYRFKKRFVSTLSTAGELVDASVCEVLRVVVRGRKAGGENVPSECVVIGLPGCVPNGLPAVVDAGAVQVASGAREVVPEPLSDGLRSLLAVPCREPAVSGAVGAVGDSFRRRLLSRRHARAKYVDDD